MNDDEKRFKVSMTEPLGFANNIKIIVDSKTGINYLFVHDGYAGGLTPLLDESGKPVITK